MSAGFRSVLVILGLSAGPAAPIYQSPGRVSVVIQFLVADVNGRVLTRLHPLLGRVSWRKNAVGTLSFSLARSDPKLREEYFVPGNRVLLQFDNGLPDWGGVLSGDREWTDAEVTFEAFSGEWLLSQRRTSRLRSFEGYPVGLILSTLIQEVNAFYPSGLKAGNIWSEGGSFGPQYVYKSLLEVVTDSLIGDYDAEAFDVTPALESGYINFYVNLYLRKGSDKPGVALVEGRNVSAVRYRERGGLVNMWYLAGEGDGWTSGSRAYATAADADSIATHGLREDFELRSGVSEQTALDMVAQAKVDETAWPTRVLGLTVTNAAPGRFADYSIGDVVTCRLYSYGFNGVHSTFEVMAMEFFPQDGTADLVLEEAGA